MPSARSLLKAVESLHQATEMSRPVWISKARRLAHINLLIKDTMQKSVLHIQLAKRPTTRNSQREEHTDGSRFHNWAEGVLIIKTIALLETLGNQARLVPLNGSISMPLDFENPFAINNIDTWLGRNKSPGIILENGLIF
jgi:hypothetical protein